MFYFFFFLRGLLNLEFFSLSYFFFSSKFYSWSDKGQGQGFVLFLSLRTRKKVFEKCRIKFTKMSEVITRISVKFIQNIICLDV